MYYFRLGCKKQINILFWRKQTILYISYENQNAVNIKIYEYIYDDVNCGMIYAPVSGWRIRYH